jgi:hypothetical protein
MKIWRSHITKIVILTFTGSFQIALRQIHESASADWVMMTMLTTVEGDVPVGLEPLSLLQKTKKIAILTG